MIGIGVLSQMVNYMKKDKHSGKAVEKVNEFINVLKNKKSKKEDKQIALKFLVHLIMIYTNLCMLVMVKTGEAMI